MSENSREKLSVFISYSRDDLDFADHLDVALDLAGFAPTLDRHGIQGAENWQERLGTLIRDADTIVFVLTPKSAASEICQWEVKQSVALGKRIIPVAARSLGEAKAPPELAALNYIYFYPEPKKPGSGVKSGSEELIKALKVDLAWMQKHTRYLQRAIEWDSGGRKAHRLISGSDDIAEAKSWMAARPKDAPAPTELHVEFVKASEAEEAREQNEERQRLADMAAAQVAREAALAEREEAVKREAEERAAREAAQLAATEAAKREAETAKRVVRRTYAGLAAALVLAATAGAFGVYAEAQRVLAEAQSAEAELQRKLAESAEAETKRLYHSIYGILFGPPGGIDKGPPELAKVKLPVPLPQLGDAKNMVDTILVNKKIVCHIELAFARLHAEGLFTKLKSFDGSYVRRKFKGSDAWSKHAYGTALDFDYENNPLKWGRDKAHFARPEYDRLHEIFEESGFFNLGRRKNYDWNSFEIKVEAVIDPAQRPSACPAE